MGLLSVVLCMFAPVQSFASQVIRYIDSQPVDEAELLRDHELARMLDRFREVGPLPFRCNRDRCKAPIAFWALSQSDARIEFGPERRPERIKGPYVTEVEEPFRSQWDETEGITSASADLVFPDLEFQQRFAPYIEWAMDPSSNVELDADPSVGAPYPLRFRFTCPNCGVVHQHTNSTMLRAFLRAIQRRKSEVRLGRI